MNTTLELHPDRLLPTDPAVRSLARRLYAEVAPLPIVSPHGHVEASLLAEDQPFGDPAALFVQPDHYVTRMLRAHGVDYRSLGLNPAQPVEPREVWRTLCSHWWAFRGTPSRYWLESELVDVFGIAVKPSAETADLLFDQLTDRLSESAFRPRALYERFNLEVLATTDDPCADLAAHQRLRSDPSWSGRVIPTFRPDAYLDPNRVDWSKRVARLGEVSGIDTGSYQGFLQALEARRRYFAENGATASDHGVLDSETQPLEAAYAQQVFSRALTGEANSNERTAFRRHMMFEMARMAAEDGLVMQLHPAVLRDHHTATSNAYGPDRGADIPVPAEFTRSLRPLLDSFGTHPNFRLVLFTIDETTFSREIAPLAGFYPSVYAGAPWWFLDEPEAIGRYRAAVTGTAGFHKTAGFVDDTRAYCSIPVRHDMARRLDCGFLARLVVEHRLDEDEAAETARDLAYELPRSVFRVGQ